MAKFHIGPFERFILIEAARIADEAIDADVLTDGDGCYSVPTQLRTIADRVEVPTDFDGRLRLFADLRAAEESLGEELKSIGSKKAALEAVLLEEFGETKTQSIARDGKTFYLSKSVLPSVVPGMQPAILDALKARGLDSMLSVNASTFASWMRSLLLDRLESAQHGDAPPVEFSEGASRSEVLAAAVPPDFAGLVTVYEKTSLRVRGA